MSNFGAVLDACVIISAAACDTLLRAAEAGLYRPFWSRGIFAEVERNLVAILARRGNLDPDTSVQCLLAELRAQFPEAMVTGYDGLIPAMTNDDKDRHVLAAAVASQAQAIITYNVRHFPASALAPHKLEVLTPDQFLTDLFDLAPERMVAILQRQGNGLRPPKTLDQVLVSLARHAPALVEAVRRYGARGPTQ